MCFSAEASFTAGVLLTFVGTETLRKVHKPSQIALASFPIFFAIQQFAEGGVWLTIGQATHAGLQTLFTHAFLVMAQMVWPILVPLAALLLEHNKSRKRILSALLVVGVAIGLYYGYRLIAHSIHAQVIGNHVVYDDTSLDSSGLVTIVLYLFATIGPLFVSSTKRVYILGIIMSLSFIVSALFYIRCLMSVWCFFAAIISFVVFYLVRDAHKRFHFAGSQLSSAPVAP